MGVAGSRAHRVRRFPRREAVARHRDAIARRRRAASFHGRRLSRGRRARRAGREHTVTETWTRGRRTRVCVSTTRSEPRETAPRFHDATAEAGLGAPRHDPPLKLTNHLISDIWPGSGVAVLDYNQDGVEDLFVADGVRSILYRNDGHGHFTDVTEQAGLAKSATEGIAATGVAAGDIDGDGYPDLFVTDAFGPARLFHNRGDGTFEEMDGDVRHLDPRDARSAAFADVDGDGDLDLFVCVTGDYYHQMPDPPFDANDGKREPSLLERRPRPLHRRERRLGSREDDPLDALVALRRLRRATAART